MKKLTLLSLNVALYFFSNNSTLRAWNHHVKNNTNETIEVSLYEIGATPGIHDPTAKRIMAPHSEVDMDVVGACINAVVIQELSGRKIKDQLDIPWWRNQCQGHNYTIDYNMFGTAEKPQQGWSQIRLD